MAHLYFNGPKSIFFKSPDLSSTISINDTSPIDPSYGSSVAVDDRTRTRQYGDGYEQVSPDGINTEELTLQLQFSTRSDVIIKELTRFFRGKGSLYDRDPQEWFWFIPHAPFDDDGNYRKFRNLPKTFNVRSAGFNNSTLTISIKEVHEP